MLKRFLILIGLALATPAWACSDALPRSANRTIDTGNIDQAAISAAILVYTNAARCQQGLPTLVGAPGLVTVSARHSDWMAQTQKMSHNATTPGLRSIRNRLDQSGVAYKKGAENIGLAGFMAIPSGESVIVNNASRCQFTRTNGTRVPAHTYGSYAQLIVQSWMNSRSHRKNIMKRGITMMGAGVGFDPRGPNCGILYATQMFAG